MIETLLLAKKGYKDIKITYSTEAKKARITIKTPTGSILQIPLILITKGSGIKFARLKKNLICLNEIGLIKVKFLSRRRIEIELTKDIIGLLTIIEKYTLTEIGELNINHLKTLLFLSANPFDNDIRSVSSYIGLSLRGTRKILNKLNSLNLISVNLNLTPQGKKFLDYIIRPHYFKHLPTYLGINPIYSAPLISRKLPSRVIKEIVRHLVENIKALYKIPENNEILDYDKICIIGVNSNRYLPWIVREISDSLDIDTIQVPLLYDKTLFNRFMHRIWDTIIMYSNIIYSRKRDHIDLAPLCKHASLIEIITHGLKKLLDLKIPIILVAQYSLIGFISYFFCLKCLILTVSSVGNGGGGLLWAITPM